MQRLSRETIRRLLKKTASSRGDKLMWCVGRLTEQYRQRMYDLLDLYAGPSEPQEPVICVDEKSKQLLRDSGPVCRGDPERRRGGLRVCPRGHLQCVRRRRAARADDGHPVTLVEPRSTSSPSPST